jgi:hypothetical protein
MHIVVPFPPLLLTCAIFAAYFASMWVLLREENKRTLKLLLTLTIVAGALRLYRIMDLPPGMNDDEIKTLYDAVKFFNARSIFSEALQVPFLHSVLFQAPLTKVIDSTFWSMRPYPLLMGTLTVPLAFAVGRAMLLGVNPSLVAAAITATMPWGLFWSRISSGGEVLFCHALLLAALAHIIWRNGGIGATLIGILGLAGLLWDYTAGWSMLAMPVVAAFLAPNRRQRILALSIVVSAVILWIPWLLNMGQWWGYLAIKARAPVPGHYSLDSFFGHAQRSLVATLRILVYPEGYIHTLSLHSIALHPLVVLVVAGIGAMGGIFRRSIFVISGFLIGLTPALATYDGQVSTHRIICSYLFIALACAIPFDLLVRKLPRTWGPATATVLAACFVGLSGVQGVGIFLSPKFWTESERIFGHSTTLLAESISLPAPESLHVDGQILRFLEARYPMETGYTVLAYDTWMPTEGDEHAISAYFQDLITTYRAELPQSQITTFGVPSEIPSIRARFTSQDAARWNSYGWTVERRCQKQQTPPARIPLFIFHNSFGWSLGCDQPTEHIFKAKWNGPVQDLLLHLSGALSITITSSGGIAIDQDKPEASKITFTLHPEEEITITMRAPNGNNAYLHRVLEHGSAPPPLESFKPVPLH